MRARECPWCERRLGAARWLRGAPARYRSPDQGGRTMDLKLEVVILPVSDVDRAKQFYSGLGWREDADIVGGEDFRIVQFTPQGSACSISFGIGVTPMTPGTQQ